MESAETNSIGSYTDLIDLARHCRQSFQRQVTTAVYHIESGVLATAILQDTYHDMRMAILVDPKTHEIRDIRAVMLRYPFNVCPEAPAIYRGLIGLKLYQPGTMKRIHELIPRRDGCTHLYHILESCIRALFIGGRQEKTTDNVYEQQIAKLSPEMRRRHAMAQPMLKGTCISFSTPPIEE